MNPDGSAMHITTVSGIVVVFSLWYRNRGIKATGQELSTEVRKW
jgi:hypothetical protein